MSYNTPRKGGDLYYMLELNEKERERKDIIDLVINKKITQKEAALKLEIMCIINSPIMQKRCRNLHILGESESNITVFSTMSM